MFLNKCSKLMIRSICSSARSFSSPKSSTFAASDKDDVYSKNPYKKDPECCVLCKYNVTVNYKNARLLSQFLSPFTGKIYDRSFTGLCSEQQKQVELAIRQAQNAGYLAVMLKKVEYKDDPVICKLNKFK